MKKLTIVIVDDAVFMRTVLRRMIEEDGNYVIVGEGADGYEAIELAKTKKPDIMTLDITMPGLDGISAVKEIISKSPDTKVIVVSAMGKQPMVIEAIKMGAKEFVVKPFKKAQVIQAIKNVMPI